MNKKNIITIIALIIIFFALGMMIGKKFTSSAESDSKILAKVGDKYITEKDLKQFFSNDYRDMELECLINKINMLNQYIERTFLQMEGKANKKTIDEMFSEYMMKNPVSVTDEEVKRFYEKYKDQIKGSYQENKEQIKRFLISQKRKKQVGDFIYEIRKKYDIKIYLSIPDDLRFKVSEDNSPYIGGENAKVVIIEFSDFKCPYCRRAVQTIHRLIKDYGNRIKIVYRNFPLKFHKGAEKAAEAALCANEQGKFWEYHDLLFANQHIISESNAPYIELAKRISLNIPQFSQCLESEKYKKKVIKDIEDGKKLGITGTPTFFVNGIKFSGARGYQFFKTLIDLELLK